MIWLAIYAPMLALIPIGILLNSDIYLVAIFGIVTTMLFSMYEQMGAAARQAMSDSAKTIQYKILIVLLGLSIFGFIAAYIFFGNLGFSGCMLGLAATLARTLLCRHTW